MNCNNNDNEFDSKWKSRKSLPHFLSDILSNKDKRVCDKKGIVAKRKLCSNDVTYFMCSDPWKMEMKSLSERFRLGEKSQQIF